MYPLKGARVHTHSTILLVTNCREVTSLLMPDVHITESQNSDVKSERNRRLQQWQLKWARSHFCDVNELPRDHTAKTHNAETHLKTSYLQWSYNYFRWQDCNALSLLCVRNTKLFRTRSVLSKTGWQQRHSNKGTKGKTILMADVLWQGGCKGFLVYSTHLPTASLRGEWKRTSTRTAKQFGQLLAFYWELDCLFNNQTKWEPRGTLNLSCSKQPTVPCSPFKKQQMYCVH